MTFRATRTVPCPSCGATLDADGHCAYCGGQARGFWNDLDLGAPDLATAVMAGLDYYLALGAPPEADAETVAEAYRSARRRYPDDPSGLHPQLARRFELLEEAWRVLGHPARRRSYDQLRREQRGATAEVRTVRCEHCGATINQAAPLCPSCGAARLVDSVPEIKPPLEDVADYYATLGVSPSLALQSVDASAWPVTRASRVDLRSTMDMDADELAACEIVPPSTEDIELGYLARQREFAFYPDPERELAVEVAHRVLMDRGYHQSYMSIRAQMRNPQLLRRALTALTALDREVRAELSGGALQAVDGSALLQQGRGYLQLHLAHQAAPVLAQACVAMPASAEAHYFYGMALWESADLPALTGHNLRQLDRVLTQAQELDATYRPQVAPFLMVARGLLHFNAGERDRALEAFAEATTAHPGFVAGWRMYAAALLGLRRFDQALQACRQALALQPQNEAILFLALSACWQQRQAAGAHEIAAHIARLRGAGTSAADIFREVGLA